MSFLHPEFIYFMLPPFVVLFALLLTQKESHEHFFSQEVMDKLRVHANTLTLKARNALFFLMGLLMILALAQPVIKEGFIEVKAKSADILIALDISDSMLAQDIYPNRLEAAKQKALELIQLAPNERIGVMAFAKNSYLVSPLSFDHSVVRFLLSQLNTDSITEKGTGFLNLLDVVEKSIENEGKKYLLILSDGGDSGDFTEEIQSAKEKNIEVYILGIATPKGSPVRLNNGNFIKYKGDIIVSKLNEKIEAFATATGGVYIKNTTSDADIKTMIAQMQSKGEKKELKSQKIQKYIPLFYYPAGLALLLLLIATSSMSKREAVHLPSAFTLFALLFATVPAKAGIFDFLDLKEAKEAYTAGDFEKSAKIYENYAQSTKDPHGDYNEANALYKQGKYTQALEAYERANFTDKENQAKKLANMGNAHTKLATQEELQKALKAYEESLKIKEDKQTRENLEEVKKFLEKQKQEEKKKENKDDQKKGNKKNQDSKKNEKNEKAKANEKNKQEDKQDQNTNDSSDTAEKKMSEAEEQKWIDQLNAGKNTYMYKLNDEEPKKGDFDEKPW